MSAAYVRLRHPKTGATWNCPAGAVKHWLPLGWEKDEGKPASGRGESVKEKSNG